jgi:hypothetical protein
MLSEFHIVGDFAGMADAIVLAAGVPGKDRSDLHFLHVQLGRFV